MPLHGELANLDRGVLELRLARNGVDRGIDGGVDAAGARKLRRPVHGGEGLALAQRRRQMHTQCRATPGAGHLGDVTVL
jgi:hypothetical protein